MRVISSTWALMSLATLVAAHKGHYKQEKKCPVDDVSVIAHTGESVGREEVHDGGN